MDDVKFNFKSMYNNDIACDLCPEGGMQDTAHLLLCQTLINNCPDLYNDVQVEYEQIFKGANDQLMAIKLYREVFKVKHKLSENLVN